jgi:hypothetical protein
MPPPPESLPPSQLTQTLPLRRPGKRCIMSTEEGTSKRAREEGPVPWDPNIVGVLVGDIDSVGNGEPHLRTVLTPARVVIRLDTIILVGRSPGNDVTFDYPMVSRRHLRLSPVRTSSSLTIVSLSDMSTYGFYLNDVFHRPDRIAKIDTQLFRCKTYILKEGDKIRLPGCPTGGSFLYCTDEVLTFHHGPSHQNDISGDAGGQLFISPTEANYLLGDWVVHNFQLGDGSFGVVNLASHRSAAWFQVACKTVKLDDDDDRARHLNEVRLLKRMRHPNVNGIIDLIREPYLKRSHMILELMAGGDLFAYQEKHGAMTEMEVCWIGWQLVQGLEYLHKKDIAHRGESEAIQS